MSSGVWVWVGHVWSDRVRLVLENYGDRITDVSIFGWRVEADGRLWETFDPTQLDAYRAKWPHLRFWLGFRNDGIASIFDAVRTDMVAQNLLLQRLGEVLDEYPWLDGVDIDLEQGGGSENAEASEYLFERIANVAQGRGKLCSAALPPLTSTGSVGGEDWVRYKELGRFLDHIAVMSYDFAWSGSAPGPISPGFWMEDVYDWASSQVTPSKISMGLPLYSYFWRIEDYPVNLGNTWRGDSGTFYAAWQHFTGYRAHDGSDANPGGSGSHHRIGWISYRDEASKSLWGFLDCYDWRNATRFDSESGLTSESFDGRPYTVRYGWPAGEPVWTVADNSPGDSHGTYRFKPEFVKDRNGFDVDPKTGYAFTVELLKRDPVAATIIDDYATSRQQLSQIYGVESDGPWQHWESDDGYKQYRGTGDLEFNHDFGADSLYLMARFQFESAGAFQVSVRGMMAELTSGGRLRLYNGSTVLGETHVDPRPIAGTPGGDRSVLAIRVRDGKTRVYYSASETSVPKRLEADVVPPGGPAKVRASSRAWIDHLYLGDGWWYQPREAVEVRVGDESRVMGRFERTGIEWHPTMNMFRPTTDIDEVETRESEASLDWVYEHWQGFPIETGESKPVAVIPLDHDVWVGKLMLLDRAGASIVYFNDVEAIAHWRARAELDWGLGGIAMWTLGQEPVTLWEKLAGGELPAHTKRLNG